MIMIMLMNTWLATQVVHFFDATVGPSLRRCAATAGALRAAGFSLQRQLLARHHHSGLGGAAARPTNIQRSAANCLGKEEVIQICYD